MTQRFTEIQNELRDEIFDYSRKHKQAPPTMCYMPINRYDELISEMRKTSVENTIEGDVMSRFLFNLYKDHYITFFGCRIYRSIVKEIDFNVPERNYL